MEVFLTVLRYVAGPLLGALIGYFTNWLAVRMLFRPYYPKKIGKFRVPFTPGIIPKRKAALAKAVGKAVGEQLFTKDDLTASIISDEAKQRVEESAVGLWKSLGDKTATELADSVIPAEKQERLKQSAEQFISDKIFSAIGEFDLGAVVADEGMKVVRQKKASFGMLAMFLSDELISSLAEKLADGVNGYVQENGREIIAKAVQSEMQKALNAPLSQITENVEESVIKNAACSLYEIAAKNVFADLADGLDVCKVVEEKINAMDVKELEKLVKSVMKKELNAIVNLGALIGLILGIVMIFV